MKKLLLILLPLFLLSCVGQNCPDKVICIYEKGDLIQNRSTNNSKPLEGIIVDIYDWDCDCRYEISSVNSLGEKQSSTMHQYELEMVESYKDYKGEQPTKDF